MTEGKKGSTGIWLETTGLIIFGAVVMITTSVVFAGIAPSPFAENPVSETSRPPAAQQLPQKHMGVDKSLHHEPVVSVTPDPECKLSVYAIKQGQACNGTPTGDKTLVSPGSIVQEITQTPCGKADAVKNATAVVRAISLGVDVINSGGSATAADKPVTVATVFTAGGSPTTLGTETITQLAAGASNKKHFGYSRDVTAIPAGPVMVDVTITYSGQEKSTANNKCTYSFTLQK